MSNVYYRPEAFGLEPIDTLDQAGLSYEFHMLCAWREKATGAVLWAEDWHGVACQGWQGSARYGPFGQGVAG